MNLDEIDMEVLKENFDSYIIEQLNTDNVAVINRYLLDNGVYYAKDIFLSSLDLFLMPPELFIKKFEKLKTKLGKNFVNELGEDSSLIEIMDED